MTSIHEIEEHFQYLPPYMLDILIELRNLMAKIAPDATEVIQFWQKGVAELKELIKQ